ncbi:MAG: adenylate/guanylate cyclase domain-containing protein, partial [Thiohalomonadales bacterium]
MNFCGHCAASLLLVCDKCQFKNPRDFAFCGGCGYDLNQPSAAIRPAINTDSAERRQLTVLFCDVVGSSILSESVDPEELREIMQKYRAVSDSVIKKYNGHTAQYLGDGILAYFGYPKANEDDAQRSVLAGIELVSQVQQLNRKLYRDHQIEISIRIGIHTGLVVVGDITGGRENSLALGTTPNIAARIQDYAKPNTVIISLNTYRLIQQLFDCKPLGEQLFKGFSTPIKVYQAIKSLDINRWIAACETKNIIPLIGREQESSLLIDRLDQAIRGTGQAVLLNGEAGIGKSRLTQYVREHVEHIPHQILECWGSPQYQNSYLHCIINVLRRTWQLDTLKTRDQQLDAIQAQLASLDIPIQDSVPLIAELLSIDLRSSSFSDSKLPPQEKKRQTLNILLSLFNNLSKQNTLILIAEDLHWIDPTTLELIGLIIDQVPTNKIFLLLTFRLEFQPPWQARSHVTQISINRLTRKQSGKMIGWITQHKKLPMELFQQIIDRTDGIPFFVAELTQMVLNSNALTEENGHYKLKNAILPLKIPATLQDSLMARLDELGPEKELAQISAIVGREFSHEVLHAVLAKQQASTSDSLMLHLSNLVCSEFLYQRGLPPHASYMFRHALVHEAAYESLLFKTRHKYHRQIAEILTENFPKIVNENPELIAHHYANGGDHLTAIKYWIIAGDTALMRSALVDAIIHLTNGLRCVEQLQLSDEKKLSQELLLQAKLAKAYAMLRGYGDSAVQKCFSRAYEISKEISQSELSLQILHGLWEYYVVRAELNTAAELAERIDESTDYINHPELATETKRVIGSTLFWKGEFSEAKGYLLEGLSQQHEFFDLQSSGTTQDPRVAGLSNLACLLWLTG